MLNLLNSFLDKIKIATFVKEIKTYNMKNKNQIKHEIDILDNEETQQGQYIVSHSIIIDLLNSTNLNREEKIKLLDVIKTHFEYIK